MKASEIQDWGRHFKPSEWPSGVLHKMDAKLFTECVFPLREKAGVPMSPSSLYDAHVRETGNSRHSTKMDSRLADATDLHVQLIDQMIKVMTVAEQIPAIGGIGIYFDTNTPLVHVDRRPDRLVWVRTHEGKYVYRENDPVIFYRVLAEEIKKAV